MPSVGTGAVPIQGVEQRVPTPGFDVSPNPLRAEPIESNAGPALNEVGNSLMHVFQAQKEHADAIDVATRMGQFQQDFGTAKQAALNSGQPAPDMVTNLQKASADLTQQYTQGTTDPQNPNPPNRAVARELQLAMARHVAEQMGSFPSEAAVRVARDLDYRFNSQNTTAAAQIGQQMQVGGTTDKPTFDFTQDGADAAALQQATIDKAYPPTARPTENQYYSQQLREKIAMQGGMWLARNHPTLIKPYIEQHAAFLTPEQQPALVNAANDAMDGPMRQIEVDGKAGEAALYNNLVNQKAQGTLSDSVVIEAVSNGIQPAPGQPFIKLAPELGAQLIGEQKIAQIEPPTIPAVYNEIHSALDMAPTKEAGEMILAGAGTKGSGVNSTDAAKLRAYWNGVAPSLNDPTTAAMREYGGPGGYIDQQYRHLDDSFVDGIGNSLNPAIATNRLAARNHFAANAKMIDDQMKSEGKSVPERLEALRKFAAETVKQYQPPPGSLIKVSPTDKGRVFAVPPSIAAKFDPNRGGLPPTSVTR